MSEKQPKFEHTQELAPDIEQFGELAHERKDALEHAERKHISRQSEREVIAEAKQLAKEAEAAHKHREPSVAERRKGPISKRQLETSFKSQMNYVQSELSTSEKTFSKVIHNKTVEKVSDIIGSTIGRPNAMLSGSIAAFLGVVVVYFVAKHYGFQLSGFETIGAFCIGWLLGILYDYFTVMIRGKKQ